jgi:hypothetical protein
MGTKIVLGLNPVDLRQFERLVNQVVVRLDTEAE